MTSSAGLNRLNLAAFSKTYTAAPPATRTLRTEAWERPKEAPTPAPAAMDRPKNSQPRTIMQ